MHILISKEDHIHRFTFSPNLRCYTGPHRMTTYWCKQTCKATCSNEHVPKGPPTNRKRNIPYNAPVHWNAHAHVCIVCRHGVHISTRPHMYESPSAHGTIHTVWSHKFGTYSHACVCAYGHKIPRTLMLFLCTYIVLGGYELTCITLLYIASQIHLSCIFNDVSVCTKDNFCPLCTDMVNLHFSHNHWIGTKPMLYEEWTIKKFTSNSEPPTVPTGFQLQHEGNMLMKNKWLCSFRRQVSNSSEIPAAISLPETVKGTWRTDMSDLITEFEFITQAEPLHT